MKMPIKDALKQHVDARQLSKAELQSLQDLQRQYQRVDPKQPYHRWMGVVAVSALVAIVIGLLQLYPASGQRDLVAEIAAEVVDNHLHMKPLEIKGSKITRIRSYFNRLDFQPIESTYLANIGLDLLGGRYCSLQNITAAQLRLKSPESDQLHTLYQVGYDPAIFKTLPNYDAGETPVSVYSQGVKVTIWVERGLLLALTESTLE